MDQITKDFTAAVQGLPPHLRALVSEAKSVRDTRGAWTLRDGDGVELVPPPSAVKAASGIGSRSVSSAAFLRVCAEIGELFGRVERRLEALEGGDTKALPSGYQTKNMSAVTDVRPRARWNGTTWEAHR